MVKLPVFDVLGRAFTAPARYGWPLLPYFLGVAAITIGLLLAIFNNFPVGAPSADDANSATAEGIGNYAGLFLIGTIILLLLFTSVAVLVHRQAAGVADKWKLGMPILRYIGVSILIMILASIVSSIALLAAGILGGGPAVLIGVATGGLGEGVSFLAAAAVFLATLAIYAFYGRIALALPATAIGEAGSISLAWQISKGNTLRLLASWVLYLALVILLQAAVGFIVGSATVFSGEGTTLTRVFGTIVMVIFLYYYVVFGIAFLTYSYLALAPNKDTAVPASPDGNLSGSAGGSA